MTTNTGPNVSNFLLGFGIGVGITLLFAPKAGEETRMYLKDKIKEGKQYAQDKTNEIQEQAKDLLNRGEQVVAREVERLASAVDAGRVAYRQSKANGSAVGI